MSRISAILHIAYSTLKIISSLLVVWIAVTWNARKARKSFEAEIMKAGVSKEDAQKLSECFMDFKDQIKNIMKKPFSSERKYWKIR